MIFVLPTSFLPFTCPRTLQVVEESRTYGDILQEDFTDSYMNLTLKSVMALKWTSTHCQQAQYLLKTDDDIFVNVPTLLTYLQEAGKTRWITGETVTDGREAQVGETAG